MVITRAGTQAILAVAWLAVQPLGTRRTFDEISKGCGVPRRHLIKIFETLLREGIVRSVQGRSGGFFLAKPPGSLTPLEVVQPFERQRKARSPYKIHPKDRGVVDIVDQTIDMGKEALVTVWGHITFADMASKVKLSKPIPLPVKKPVSA